MITSYEFFVAYMAAQQQQEPASVLLGLGTCPVHECGAEIPCIEHSCLYCESELVDERCPDASCEGSYVRPSSRSRFGTRNW